MNNVTGIVANGKPQVVAWMEAQDKKRMEKLQEKSQNGTISKMEQAELYTRKAAEAIKIVTIPQISFAGVQRKNVENENTQNLTVYDIENLAAREDKGLNPKIIAQITQLRKEQRELFYLKDEKGNYMVPTKVLNRLTENKNFKIENDPLSRRGVTLTTDDCNTPKVTYKIGLFWENQPDQHVTIQKVGSSARLETNLNGEYKNKTDDIVSPDVVERGKTKHLD